MFNIKAFVLKIDSENKSLYYYYYYYLIIIKDSSTPDTKSLIHVWVVKIVYENSVCCFVAKLYPLTFNIT